MKYLQLLTKGIQGWDTNITCLLYRIYHNADVLDSKAVSFPEASKELNRGRRERDKEASERSMHLVALQGVVEHGQGE